MRSARAVYLGVVCIVAVSVVCAFFIVRATTSSPAAGRASARSTSGFPTSATTGVPSGVTLSKYTGPCTVSDGSTVKIDAKDVTTTCSSLVAYNGNFVITRSKIPSVLARWPGSVSATDSDIWAGDQSANSASGTYNPTYPTTGYNLTLRRVDVQGGKDSVECGGNCLIVDSYLHNQRAYNGSHIQGFLSSGGNHMVLRHNSIACDPPTAAQGIGCTGDVALFGDEAPVHDVLINNNLFLSLPYPGYCLYGGYQPGKAYPVSTDIRITNNVFVRGASGSCGTYGPVTSVKTSASGNIWSNNQWSTGGVISATS